jgi:predicted ABC-type ATPase
VADSSPSVIVLAGPNGAGKTTAARILLAVTLNVRTFVNADVIAQGLAGFDPESAAIAASRIMLERLHRLAEQRADFAFETTLAGRTLAEWLKDLRQTGYLIHLVYFWLESADLAVARVASRVRLGGHDIPETTTRRRYDRSIQNFFRLYRSIVNFWQLYDNSVSGIPRIVAGRDEQGNESISFETLWRQIQGEAL